ncbi:MAG TPA: HAMP domain-containing sensor histidine kinase [Mycobacteriales bacterium]|nr:HAMP domain-containing sensor histidine kinase [Mycobacteriales bacterium]
MSRPRFTLRLRLTLLYGGLLVLVGCVLLAMSAVLLDRSLESVLRFQHGAIVPAVDSNGRLFLVDAEEFERAVTQDARGELVSTGALAFGVVVLVGAAAGYILAGQALQPVSQVTATARRLSTETLHDRIALTGPDDELKELADTFDDMLARLDAAFDSQRRFVANASHELRTPLAVIRTEVDVALADPEPTVVDLCRMAGVVRDATRRADRLVEALLVLARSEAQERQGLEVYERVDLAVLVPRAVRALSTEASSRGVGVIAEVDSAPVWGDPSLLERLVANLVENAIRHNVDGGHVAVTTGTEQATAWLSVRNTGTILEEITVQDLFAPFRRGGTARTANRGAGLGLSIVRAVASAHGGEATARPLAEGGLEVHVRLPAVHALESMT